MGLDDAYNKALEAVAQVDLHEAAFNSGVGFDGEIFTIPLFNRIYKVRTTGFEVCEAGSEVTPPRILEILLMHYLAQADGTALSGMWIAYRQLPGGQLFERRFTNLVSRPLVELFGGDIDGFSESALALGGQSMERMGDASFRFTALPRVPIACSLSRGEDDIPPSINILFDETASHYLDTEDLTILGGLMNSYLKACRKKDI